VKSVEEPAERVPDENHTPKNTEPIGKSGVSESKGHKDRHEYAEGRESHDIAENAHDEGAYGHQKENAEGGLKLFRETKERPAIQKSFRLPYPLELQAPLTYDLFPQGPSHVCQLSI
jgi:hypothetical protein